MFQYMATLFILSAALLFVLLLSCRQQHGHDLRPHERWSAAGCWMSYLPFMPTPRLSTELIFVHFRSVRALCRYLSAILAAWKSIQNFGIGSGANPQQLGNGGLSQNAALQQALQNNPKLRKAVQALAAYHITPGQLGNQLELASSVGVRLLVDSCSSCRLLRSRTRVFRCLPVDSVPQLVRRRFASDAAE